MTYGLFRHCRVTAPIRKFFAAALGSDVYSALHPRGRRKASQRKVSQAQPLLQALRRRQEIRRSIACLPLQSIGSEKGPAGGKGMTQTTFIQRLNTKGGSAPADGCLVAGDVGKQTLVPYTADYYFFRKDK
jgi:Protein of unknown function (DUF3455)